MNTFCTIITASYYPYAVALYKSLRKYDPEVSLQLLVADGQAIKKIPGLTGMHIVPIETLHEYPLVNSLYKKYAHLYGMDLFRWSLKPVFMNYLLDKEFDKVIFLDCDIFFFSDHRFLLDELDNTGILLTPHWHNSNPLTDETSFLHMLTTGMFNAGFVGASRMGIPALQWWANACHFKMGESITLGIVDDQRYLDILPVKFDMVKILRHKGCNLSTGNFEECPRVLVNDTVMIDGRYPVIFIHFTQTMAIQILKGHDPLLLPLFNEYKKIFEEDGTSLGQFMKQLDTHISAGPFTRLKWSLRLKTRIKRLLYSWAQRL
jgi:hypothetical protein